MFVFKSGRKRRKQRIHAENKNGMERVLTDREKERKKEKERKRKSVNQHHYGQL